MSERLGQLLVKALNALPPAEQGELLAELLGPRRGAQPLIRLNDFPGGPEQIQVAAVQMIEDLRVPVGAANGPPQPAQSATPLKVLPVRLPAADYERLRAWAKGHDFSMAVIVRTLVERFLQDRT
jgi:hypothetical protein